MIIDFIKMITRPEIFMLLVLLKAIVKIEQIKQNACFEKIAASVTREFNALGRIPAEVQKILRQPSVNVAKMVENYNGLSQNERLRLTKNIAPELFKPTIGRGRKQRPNPNYRLTAFSPEEYENHISKTQLPSVLKMVEGLERGTGNLIRKNGFIPLEYPTNLSNQDDIMLGSLLFGNKQSFYNKTKILAGSLDRPDIISQQKIRSMLKSIQNNYKLNKEDLDNIKQYIYQGNQPGFTFIKAPITDCVSKDSLEEFNRQLKRTVVDKLTEQMRKYVRPDWGNEQDIENLLSFLGLNNNLTFEGVPLNRIINAIVSRHEVMEALEKKRSILKNSKNKLLSTGSPWDMDRTTHYSPAVIADEVMNLNSIFGHPANNNFFKTTRAEENITSPSYNALGVNYIDSSKLPIKGNSRRDVMREARSYADNDLHPFSSISSSNISDFIDENNHSIPKNYYSDKKNENNVNNYFSTKNNEYNSSHYSLASKLNDNGDSLLKRIFNMI